MLKLSRKAFYNCGYLSSIPIEVQNSNPFNMIIKLYSINKFYETLNTQLNYNSPSKWNIN